mmetsp:Transcript_6527/g.11241  ORF Transcript_6527/g.11241 Transcript_6527/m.11241 type:complete len:93 (+) Transcript_6527:3-281(+)
MGREDVLNFDSVAGALAVLTGFVLVNIGQQQEEEETNFQIHQHQHGEETQTRTEADDEMEGIESDGTHHRHRIHHMSLEFSTDSDGLKHQIS